jgi:hypothetical protein
MVMMLASWLIVLIMGRMPQSLHEALAAILRYGACLKGYWYMLTLAMAASEFLWLRRRTDAMRRCLPMCIRLPGFATQASRRPGRSKAGATSACSGITQRLHAHVWLGSRTRVPECAMAVNRPQTSQVPRLEKGQVTDWLNRDGHSCRVGLVLLHGQQSDRLSPKLDTPQPAIAALVGNRDVAGSRVTPINAAAD